MPVTEFNVGFIDIAKHIVKTGGVPVADDVCDFECGTSGYARKNRAVLCRVLVKRNIIARCVAGHRIGGCKKNGRVLDIAAVVAEYDAVPTGLFFAENTNARTALQHGNGR